MTRLEKRYRAVQQEMKQTIEANSELIGLGPFLAGILTSQQVQQSIKKLIRLRTAQKHPDQTNIGAHGANLDPELLELRRLSQDQVRLKAAARSLSEHSNDRCNAYQKLLTQIEKFDARITKIQATFAHAHGEVGVKSLKRGDYRIAIRSWDAGDGEIRTLYVRDGRIQDGQIVRAVLGIIPKTMKKAGILTPLQRLLQQGIDKSGIAPEAAGADSLFARLQDDVAAIQGRGKKMPWLLVTAGWSRKSVRLFIEGQVESFEYLRKESTKGRQAN